MLKPKRKQQIINMIKTETELMIKTKGMGGTKIYTGHGTSFQPYSKVSICKKRNFCPATAFGATNVIATNKRCSKIVSVGPKLDRNN